MKKVLSLILSFLFFLEVLPWSAIADETYENDFKFTEYNDSVPDAEIRAAVALAGLEDNAPLWHEGMTAQECTNASQLLEVLKDFVYNQLDGVIDVFQDYDMLRSEKSLTYSDEFDKAYTTALNLQDDIYYYLDVLEENSRQISYRNLLMQDADITEEDRISYGFSIREYYDELKTAFTIIKNDLSDWDNKCDNWDRMLCGETESFKEYAEVYANAMLNKNTLLGTSGPVLLAQEKDVAPASGNRIIDRLSPVTSALADTRQKMEITVVDDRSFVVRARDNGTNVSGATVTLTDVNKSGKSTGKSQKRLTTNTRGAVVGLVRDYSPDKDGFIYLDIGIEKSGYRNLLLRKVELKKGNTFNVRLEKDDGTPYIIEASYNGSDMKNNRYDLLVTNLSEITDEITLTTYGKKAYTFDLYYTKDGKKTVIASNVQGKSGQQTKTSIKRQFAKQLPGDIKLFVDLKYDGQFKTVPLQLKTIKAVVDEPMNLPGLANVFNKNITLNLPASWPGPLSKLKVTIDIPIVDKWPFNAMLLPNGMGFVMIGFHSGQKPINKQTDDAKLMSKIVKLVEEEGWRRVQEIKSGGASDCRLPIWKLGTLSLEWCIIGYGTGQFTSVKGRDDLRVIRLAGNVGLNVKLQGDVQFIFGGIATIGLTGTLNAIASLGLGVNIFYANSGKNWKYQSWSMSPSNTGFTITARLEIGVFAGLGYKGVASVTITGYGFGELIFRFGKTRSFTLNGGFGAKLTAQFFFVKAVKQLGEEIKYQLYPEFKRISRSPAPIERFVQMFNPPTAVADSKNNAPGIVSTTNINEKLVLNSTDPIKLENLQDDSISVVRITSGTSSTDYAFYLAENPSQQVELFLRSANGNDQPKSVLELIYSYYNAQDPCFSGSTGSNRFYEKDNTTFDTVKSWNVVGYHVETLTPQYDSKPDSVNQLIVVTMLMANEYTNVTLDDGSTVRLPKKTAAVIATFINDTTNGIKLGSLSSNSNYKFGSSVCVFMVANENDAPICQPITETEITRETGTPEYPRDSFWIRLTCSPARPAKAEEAKTFTIQLDLGLEADNEQRTRSRKIDGYIKSKTLGQGNAEVNKYTFDHVQPGRQSIQGHPYEKDDDTSSEYYSSITVQDHWYALAAPDSDSDERLLVVNYNVNNPGNDKKGTGLYVLDKDTVLDYCVYKKEGIQNNKLGEDFLVYLTKGADNKMNRIRGGCISTSKSYDASNKPIYLQRLYWADMIDFDVPASAAQLHVSSIFGVPLVWWLESVTDDDKTNKATWAVRACWMEEAASKRNLSKPMTLAVIRDASSSDNLRGPVFFDLLEYKESDGTGGIKGYYAIKSEEQSGTVYANLYQFSFKLTSGLDLISSTFTKDIATAGSYDDIQVAMHNNGNVPISAVDLGIYHINRSTGTGTRLQNIHVNLEGMNSSSVTIYGTDGTTTKRTITNSSNKHQAVRLINSGLSKNLDNRWTINEWRVHTDRSQTKSRMQNVTSLSMPDTYDTLLMTVQIPRNWAGDYTLEIRVDKIYVRDKINFQTSRPQSSSRAALPPAKFLFTVPSAFAENESSANADLGNLLNLTPGSNGKAVIKNDSGDIINNNIMFSDNVDFDILSLDTEVKDIELNVDTWVDGEVDMATIYLNESALRFLIEKQKNVVLRSYVDDEDSPSFEWILNSTEESYQQYMRDGTGWSLDIPMSVLTNGKNPYELKVVVDTGDDDESLFTNNYDILYMDSSPMVITLEPEDRTVTAGSDTTFTVAVTGGHRPYSYQWQVLMPGGKWEDIPEAWTSRLTLHGVTAQMNGAQYRCIIEDASGRVLTSRHAILSVISSDLPPTGDTQNLSLWLILFALCGASFLIFLLMRRKKH